MKRFMGLLVPVIVAGAMLCLPAARSEMYQYEDENGAVSFTDDPAKIPKKLRKSQRIVDAGTDDSSITPVTINGNQVLIPVTVAYRGKEAQATFLLDTGATTCTISPELAARLNIRPTEQGATLARGVGGAAFLVGSAKLDYVVAGPNRKYDVKASIISSGNNDGLLGMNFLRELRYHIDFNTHTIKWGD